MLWDKSLVHLFMILRQLHNACQLWVKQQLVVFLLLSTPVFCSVDGFFSIRPETLVRGRFVITRLCHELAFVQWYSIFACSFESGQSRYALNFASARSLGIAIPLTTRPDFRASPSSAPPILCLPILSDLALTRVKNCRSTSSL